MNLNTRQLLLSIKNASLIKIEKVNVPLLEQNLILIELLYTQGFIQSFSIDNSSKKIVVFLRYYDNKPALRYLKLISKSSILKNLTFLELVKFFNKRFVLFLSTNKGLTTSYFCKKNNISGKGLFLC